MTPEAGTNIVTASGQIQDISNGDQIRLLRNIGTVETRSVSIMGAPNSDIFTFDPIGVESVTMNTYGSGYTVPPAVQFTPSPSGDTATGLAQIIGGISTITVVDGGSGYPQDLTQIQVIIDSPDRSPRVKATAEVTAVNSEGAITAISVTNPGDGYTTKPTITITAPHTKSATIDYYLDGKVTEILMVNKGSGYSSTTPTVTITPRDNNITPVAPTTTVVKTAVTDLALYTNYIAAGSDANKVKVKLFCRPVNDLKYRQSPALDPVDVAKLELIEKYLVNLSAPLRSFNTSTGLFEVRVSGISDTQDVLSYVDSDANIANSIENVGLTVVVRENYNDSTPITVVNATSTTFQFERPNTGYSTNVTIEHLNKTEVIAPAHGLEPGELVRINTNNFRGEYEILNVLTPSSFVIKAPYDSNFVAPGTLYGKGIKITTVAPHGISPIYVASNKKLAVHFAEPKTFNKVYRVSRVTPTELFIDNNWAPISGGSVFYETRKGTLSGANPYIDPNTGSATDALISNDNVTNVITVSNEGRLVDKLVTYSANAQPVPPQFVSVRENTKIVIDSAALPSVNFDGTYPAVDITVVRQRLRVDEKYALVTTLDHDVVNINGYLIKLDNYNNPSSIADSINRQIDLRKQFIRQPRNPQLDEGLKLGFVMTKDPFVPVMGNMSSRSISNYGPFIRDKDLIEKLSGGELTADNELVLVSGAEKPLDQKFNKGEVFVGPVRGL